MMASPTTAPRRRWRSALWKLVRISVFVLVLVEAFFRFAYLISPSSLGSLGSVRRFPFSPQRLGAGNFVILFHDPDYDVALLPGVVNQQVPFGGNRSFAVTIHGWKQDRAGFRSAMPADGQMFAVALGDSFTFCMSIAAECWVDVLADRLGLPVLNLGVPITGSRSHANYYRDFIADPTQHLSAPKLVLWQFFGNDYNEDYGFAVLSGTNETPPETRVTTPLERWLAENSVLGRFLEAYTSTAYVVQSGLFAFAHKYEANGLNLSFDQRGFRDSADMRAPQNQEGEVISHAAILETRDRVEAAGGAFVLIAMPYKEEVYRAVTEPLMGAESLDALAEPRQRILAFCAAEKLRCFDPLAALQAAREQVYYPEDIHLNPAGNRVLAEALAAYLREAGIRW